MKKTLIILLSVFAFYQANATVYPVTTASDNASGTNPAAFAGTGTLRQAIIDANAHVGADIISFNIPGGGTKTLTLSALLPLITDPVNINGYDQPGSFQGQLGTGARIIRIEINAGSASSGVSRPANSENALFCFTKIASSSSISGLSIYNTEQGVEAILVEPDAGNIHIWGNYIGVLASGNSPASTADYNGAEGVKLSHYNISSGAFNAITIGTNGDGTNDANEGNVVANSSDPVKGGDGIEIGGTGTSYTYNNVKISGNYIGIAADGITAAPNGASSASSGSLSNGGEGINLINAYNIQIGSNGDGSSDALERNVISGNYENGININTCGNGGNINIAGNYIGTDKSGTVAIPNAGNSDKNGSYAGIMTYGNSSNIIIGFDDATHNASAAADVRNVVSGNKASGVSFNNNASATNNRISGNYIGVDVTGNTRLGNGQGNTPAPSNIFAPAISLNNSIKTWVGTDGDGNNDALEGNIISGSFQGNGVYIFSNANANIVAGNYIGLGADGTTDIGNDWYGVYVNGSDNNRIGSDGNGTADALERNIISGNFENGIYINACSNINIAGNYIGTDKTGTSAIPNAKNSSNSNAYAGVFVNGSSSNIIIGFDDTRHLSSAAADVRNIISGNKATGVDFYNNPSATNNHISGNYIGVDVTGNTRLGNGQGNTPVASNILAAAVDLNNSTNTWVGTDGDGNNDALEGNIISGSFQGNGIYITNNANSNIVAGNYIGLGVDGTTAIGNDWVGISVNGTSNNRIGSDGNGTADALEKNIISGNFFEGIYMNGSNGVSIAGNYIGTDKNGTASVPNGKSSTSSSTYYGIRTQTSSNIIIGFNDAIHSAAVAADVRNIISGNYAAGVLFNNNSAATNRISGNYIGVNITGNTRLGNGQGNQSAEILNATGIDVTNNNSNTLIGTNSNGDDDVLERNIISGNIGGGGINIDASSYNIVAENYIGVGANGTTAIGNGWSGIALQNGSNNNRIGSNDDGANDAVEANIIANNAFSTITATSDGVRITDNSTGNRISRNIFYTNKGNPIDLTNDGVSPNDGATTSGRPNRLLDYPVITSASVAGSTVTVAGYVSTCGGIETTAGPSIAGNKIIQFYKEANDGDQDGPLTNGSCTRIVNHGEGIQYLGSITGVVNTFSTSFTLAAGATLTASDKITGITIDASGNTSEFGVATAMILLPVQLLDFTAAQKGNTSILNWSTATESNNRGFDIERSADGTHFSKIGFVSSAAAGGNSTTLLHYTSTDAQPLEGINYYRLKQTDIDGKINYSAVATVNFRKGNSISLSAYPNPVASELSITIAGITRFTQANITVYSAVGQVVYKTNITRQIHTIDCSKFQEGVYFIIYTDAAGNRIQTKVTKN